MRVTVCELNNEPEEFLKDWQRLVEYVHSSSSEFVLLPEMPFYPWIAGVKEFNPSVWNAAISAHDVWLNRIQELAPAIVAGTRPVNKNGKRHNEGFVWDKEFGYQLVHTKYYLPDEERFWEASWYERGEKQFQPVRIDNKSFGMLICTEIWFSEHAGAYGRKQVHIIAAPRATERASADKWLAGGRTAAVNAGAYCLSSNRGSVDKHGMDWAGQGWIIEPDGEVLALTSPELPFITKDIDLSAAELAKKTYPRYVQE